MKTVSILKVLAFVVGTLFICPIYSLRAANLTYYVKIEPGQPGYIKAVLEDTSSNSVEFYMHADYTSTDIFNFVITLLFSLSLSFSPAYCAKIFDHESGEKYNSKQIPSVSLIQKNLAKMNEQGAYRNTIKVYDLIVLNDRFRRFRWL